MSNPLLATYFENFQPNFTKKKPRESGNMQKKKRTILKLNPDQVKKVLYI